ncbi:hypothetical protein [Phaeobacter italicus]|uniref:hypothetical protein n=1 Tax=Phaeobacter italicus TaxID=481446 RepID=UPI000669C81E|nr:hypothetical protein [Phaeobacter italicus]CRL16213.1 hypothetical protein NIT7645_03279 [Phaeobacter italicus]SFG80575.1 hypothetical protein SAMN04488019_1042 [Phaeobacter italicus]
MDRFSTPKYVVAFASTLFWALGTASTAQEFSLRMTASIDEIRSSVDPSVDNSGFEAIFEPGSTKSLSLTVNFSGPGQPIISGERLIDRDLITGATVSMDGYEAVIPGGSVITNDQQSGSTHIDEMLIVPVADESAPKAGTYNLKDIAVRFSSLYEDVVKDGETTVQAVATLGEIVDPKQHRGTVQLAFTNPAAEGYLGRATVQANINTWEVVASGGSGFSAGEPSAELSQTDLFKLGEKIVYCMAPRGLRGVIRVTDITHDMGNRGRHSQNPERVRNQAKEAGAEYRALEIFMGYGGLLGEYKQGIYFITVFENERGEIFVNRKAGIGTPNSNYKRENDPCPMNQWVSVDAFR